MQNLKYMKISEGNIMVRTDPVRNHSLIEKLYILSSEIGPQWTRTTQSSRWDQGLTGKARPLIQRRRKSTLFCRGWKTESKSQCVQSTVRAQVVCWWCVEEYDEPSGNTPSGIWSWWSGCRGKRHRWRLSSISVPRFHELYHRNNYKFIWQSRHCIWS